MTDAKWLVIDIKVSKDDVELIETLLLNLGAKSISLSEEEDEPLFQTNPGEIKLWNQLKLEALFAATVEPELIRLALNNHFKEMEKNNHLSFSYIDNLAWIESWKKTLRPMKFGNNLWIVPSGHESQLNKLNNSTIIQIDPGLAFGSGEHETTRLCLEWLEQQNLHGKTVVDYGCGSGVLAIAAQLLGAQSIIAIDHDPQAITATKCNITKNQIENSIKVQLPDLSSNFNADILIANILAKPLINLCTYFYQQLNPGGIIALSGILSRQKAEIIATYEPYFENFTIHILNDWLLVTAIKKAN